MSNAMQHTMPARARLVTAEEFARIPDDDQHRELVEGRVVRLSPPGFRHGLFATRIAALLSQHVDAHRLGAVDTPAGFWIATDPDTVREPDARSSALNVCHRQASRTASGRVHPISPSKSTHRAIGRR